MPRYVLLEHDHPHLHWDLMLEAGAALLTWRLPAPPAPGETLTAQRIGAHRPAYLDYEGPIAGDRGRVRRWDAGVFAWVQQDDQQIIVELQGGRLTGTLRLEWREGDDWQAHFGQTE